MRRGFLWRAGCLAAAVLVLGTVGAIVLAWHVATALGLPAAGAGTLAVLATLTLVVLIGAAVLWRTMRRFTVPFGDLIEAAGRVEAGDYAARVAERPAGPPPVRALVRAFNGMATRLESDEQQRRTFMADIGHELRTPLAVLQGELEAILDGVHPPDAAHLGTALDETQVLARLVDDLRTLAFAESGTLTLHREATDLEVLIAEVARSAEPAAVTAGVEIAVETAGDLPLIEVDPVRIREVLVNLLGNALRYAPRGSAVRVTAGLDPDRRAVSIAVVDAGPGIPAELQGRAFERFAKSPDSRGSGLGLAIARQLVEAHRGQIGAQSVPSGGTRIWMTLPVGPG
jgi:two-component system, OmpR family, sensor histidine kinase BaeS